MTEHTQTLLGLAATIKSVDGVVTETTLHFDHDTFDLDLQGDSRLIAWLRKR